MTLHFENYAFHPVKSFTVRNGWFKYEGAPYLRFSLDTPDESGRGNYTEITVDINGDVSMISDDCDVYPLKVIKVLSVPVISSKDEV